MSMFWILMTVAGFYALWATYMKTYRTTTWLQLQEAGDRRRAKTLAALGQSAVALWEAATSRLKVK